jgi:diamine N-acetyltransferase
MVNLSGRFKMKGKIVQKPKIKYIHGDEGRLDEIKTLWENLNQYHLNLSPNFKQYYREMTFPKRKVQLLKRAVDGQLHVDLAMDETSNQTVGYCVSSLNREKSGAIESIFVAPTYRNIRIGDALMKNALKWLDQNGAVEKIVEVGAGNEQVFGFYARYGFLPRKTMLKQVKR